MITTNWHALHGPPTSLSLIAHTIFLGWELALAEFTGCQVLSRVHFDLQSGGHRTTKSHLGYFRALQEIV